MHDFQTVKGLSEQQLIDFIRSIDSKLMGVSSSNTSGTIDLLLQQKEIMQNEIQERRMMESLKKPPMPSMSLTSDALSEQEAKDAENEAKNKQ